LREDHTIRLDVPRLDTIAGTLPEPMREPFLWLGCFVREHCSRDCNIAVEAFRKVGVYHDVTTWTRIFSDRWQKGKDGELLPHPILSQEKFLESVTALRQQVRVEELRGKVPFVETSTWQRIEGFIDEKRAPQRVNRFGVIYGYTGTQKTACCREYQRRHNHCSVVRIEAPERPSITQFHIDLCAAYGGSATLSSERRRQRIRDSLDETRTIIVENTQRLCRRDHEDQPVFSYLQKLQEDTGCCVILTFTFEGAKILTQGMTKGYFEQFEGRAGGRRNFLRLDEYPPDEDVLAIARAFKLREPSRHLKYLAAMAREPGRIRILFEDLQQGKVVAAADGKDLSIDYVRAARGEEE